MSTNCLITKLKGVVENDNLEKFGSFKVEPDREDTTLILGMSFNSPLNVTVHYKDDTEQIIPNTMGINDEYPNAKYIEIDNKYKITEIYINSASFINLDKLLYLTELVNLRCSTNVWLSKNEFDIANLHKLTKLRTIGIPNSSNVKGSLSDFVNHPNVENINFIDIRESSISGTLGDLLPCTNIQSIQISYCDNITVKRSDLNAFAARNVTVTYSQTPIEDV